MAKDAVEKHPVTSALRMFGVIRIWASIVLGSLVLAAAATCFVLSYTWESNYDEVMAEVTDVKCGGVQKVTECSHSGTKNTCVTSENVECELALKYAGGEGAMSLMYDEGFQPARGDNIPVFVDRDDPTKIAERKLTQKQRAMVRIIAGVVGGISLVVVVVNIVLVNNKAFRTLQGGIGAVGALGAAM